MEFETVRTKRKLHASSNDSDSHSRTLSADSAGSRTSRRSRPPVKKTASDTGISMATSQDPGGPSAAPIIRGQKLSKKSTVLDPVITKNRFEVLSISLDLPDAEPDATNTATEADPTAKAQQPPKSVKKYKIPPLMMTSNSQPSPLSPPRLLGR